MRSLAVGRLLVPWPKVNVLRSLSLGSKRYHLPTEKENANLIPLRHSTAHVMAMAVQSLYPEGKVTIGPCIQNGYVSLSLYSFNFILFTSTGSITISFSPRESSLTVI
jgi:hypothetical protein